MQHLASQNGHSVVVEELIRAGADVNAQRSGGYRCASRQYCYSAARLQRRTVTALMGVAARFTWPKRRR